MSYNTFVNYFEWLMSDQTHIENGPPTGALQPVIPELGTEIAAHELGQYTLAQMYAALMSPEQMQGENVISLFNSYLEKTHHIEDIATWLQDNGARSIEVFEDMSPNNLDVDGLIRRLTQEAFIHHSKDLPANRKNEAVRGVVRDITAYLHIIDRENGLEDNGFVQAYIGAILPPENRIDVDEQSSTVDNILRPHLEGMAVSTTVTRYRLNTWMRTAVYLKNKAQELNKQYPPGVSLGHRSSRSKHLLRMGINYLSNPLRGEAEQMDHDDLLTHLGVNYDPDVWFKDEEVLRAKIVEIATLAGNEDLAQRVRDHKFPPTVNGEYFFDFIMDHVSQDKIDEIARYLRDRHEQEGLVFKQTLNLISQSHPQLIHQMKLGALDHKYLRASQLNKKNRISTSGFTASILGEEFRTKLDTIATPAISSLVFKWMLTSPDPNSRYIRSKQLQGSVLREHIPIESFVQLSAREQEIVSLTSVHEVLSHMEFTDEMKQTLLDLLFLSDLSEWQFQPVLPIIMNNESLRSGTFQQEFYERLIARRNNYWDSGWRYKDLSILGTLLITDKELRLRESQLVIGRIREQYEGIPEDPTKYQEYAGQRIAPKLEEQKKQLAQREADFAELNTVIDLVRPERQKVLDFHLRVYRVIQANAYDYQEELRQISKFRSDAEALRRKNPVVFKWAYRGIDISDYKEMSWEDRFYMEYKPPTPTAPPVYRDRKDDNYGLDMLVEKIIEMSSPEFQDEQNSFSWKHVMHWYNNVFFGSHDIDREAIDLQTRIDTQKVETALWDEAIQSGGLSLNTSIEEGGRPLNNCIHLGIDGRNRYELLFFFGLTLDKYAHMPELIGYDTIPLIQTIVSFRNKMSSHYAFRPGASRFIEGLKTNPAIDRDELVNDGRVVMVVTK